jgi:hypothetical protein
MSDVAGELRHPEDARTIRSVLPLSGVLLMLVTSCSWITDIAILNRTSDPVLITYWVRRRDPADPYCRCPAGYVLNPPAVVEEKRVRKNVIDWSPLDSSAFRWDHDSLRLEFVLPPGTALRLEELSTYTGPDSWQAAEFNITALEIAQGAAVIRYEGDSLLYAFRERSKALYVLEYPELAPQVEPRSPLLGDADGSPRLYATTRSRGTGRPAETAEETNP